MTSSRAFAKCPGCGCQIRARSTTCHACRPRSTPLERRLWGKVEWSEGCWNWLGALTRGYGKLHVGMTGEQREYGYAHRVAYELVVGPIPEGMHLDHLCRNTRCVNPAHLEPVTPRMNALRSPLHSVKQEARTHCAAGHPFPPEYRPKRRCRECIKDTYRARVAA